MMDSRRAVGPSCVEPSNEGWDGRRVIVRGWSPNRQSEGRDAGGSRTHLNRVAAGRLAVWLQRQEGESGGDPCPRQELNLVYDLRRIACTSPTLRGRLIPIGSHPYR